MWMLGPTLRASEAQEPAFPSSAWVLLDCAKTFPGKAAFSLLIRRLKRR